MRLKIPRVKASIDTEDQHGTGIEIVPLEAAIPHTRIEVHFKDISDINNASKQLDVTHTNKFHVKKISHEIINKLESSKKMPRNGAHRQPCDFVPSEDGDDLDSLLTNINVGESLVHQSYEEIKGSDNSETTKRENMDWFKKEVNIIPCQKVERSSSKLPFGCYTAKRAEHRLHHQMIKQEESNTRFPEEKISEACCPIPCNKTPQAQTPRSRARICSSVSEIALDKVTNRLYQDGMMKKQQINIMLLNIRKATSFQVSSYSRNYSHCDNDLNVKKDKDVYNRLYDDSKHQRIVGLKRRVEIATAIQERRRKAELRPTKKLSTSKAEELYTRLMEQMYLTEQKKAELARARGVPFISRYQSLRIL